MSYYYESSAQICLPKNIKGVRDRLTGCDYGCFKTIERVFWEGGKIIGGEVIGFILDDGEIFSINRVEAVLWIDSDQQEYWIEPSEYQGFFTIPDDFDDTYAAKIPNDIRQGIEQLSFSTLQ